jgi:general secretion pathway protein D/MSHA biogenesis protein MshL
MLVIGGLISSTDQTEGTFVPGTSKIPFFKYLFGFEKKLAQKRELIILLKPRII